MAQQQVLSHEIVARARPSQDGCEQQPQYFEHAFSIADLRRARFCRRTAGDGDAAGRVRGHPRDRAGHGHPHGLPVRVRGTSSWASGSTWTWRR